MQERFKANENNLSNITQFLEAAQSGDKQAAADLLPLVYDELRQLAATRMAAERPDHTLDATALVHEAYLRLAGSPVASAPGDEAKHGALTQPRSPEFANRAHFFAAAAEAMRRILVDSARRRQAVKRGGGCRANLDLDRLPAASVDADVLAVDESLDRLAVAQPEVAKLVTLRYFGGLTIVEAAATLGVSPRTADAWWSYARAWLAADLGTGEK